MSWPVKVGAVVFCVVFSGSVSVTAWSGEPGVRRPRVVGDLPVTPMDQREAFAHNSPFLLADPNDERIIVMASRTDNPDFGCSIQASGDHGATWLPLSLPPVPEGADKCYGPEVAYDSKGTLKFLFVGLAGRGNSPVGAYLADATPDGFGPPRQVLGPERYMVRMAIDPSIGENGRLYLVWLQAGADPPLGGLPPVDNPIMAAYSDDGGKSFSEPVRVSDPERKRAVAPALVIGRDRSVHVAYYDLEDDLRDYQGLEGPRWEGNWSLVVSSSTNGGRSFSRGTVVDAALVPPERVMLIFTMPPPAFTADDGGRLYLAWHDARNGDWDVFLSSSSDEKAWSKPTRLNDDPLRNGRHQHMPRLSASAGGRLDAIWYDRRDDPANQKANVYFTSSTDGGATFTRNARVTNEPSDTMVGPRYPIPSALNLVEFGGRIALLSKPESALAAWTDTRNSFSDSFQQEIYAARIIPEDMPAATKSAPLVFAASALALLAVAVLLARGRAVAQARKKQDD